MSGEIEIINLVDNNVTMQGLLAEHGLSFLVRDGGAAVLWDTGAGAVINNNILSLGINPGEITAAALSHGHYDHGGGLKKVCELTGPLQLFAHPDIFGSKYKLNADNSLQPVGIPWSQEELTEKGAIYHLDRGVSNITENILLTGEIPRRHVFEVEKNDFFLQNNNEYIPDNLMDDQSLVVVTVKGPVVITGCAHSGIINTLEHVLDITGASRIYGVIGGLHLKEAGPERIERTVKEITRFDLEFIAGFHCTGFAASAAFARTLGDRFIYGYTGRSFTI